MDQFSAHLDRGWDLISRGDLPGAEASAHRALELDAESPEAFNLLGYAAALSGEFEDAMEHYQQAIALDDTYLEAMLNAAELLIHPFADYEAADRLCDDALELAETLEERVDVLLLRFDALMGQDKKDLARQLCERLPRGPFENPGHAFLVGRALYETGQIDEAAPLLEQAIQLQADNPEAHYYLGLIFDEREDNGRAVEAFLEARRLDLEVPHHGFALSRDAFRDAARSVIAELPSEMQSRVTAAELYFLDVPGAEVVIDGVDPRAVLLVETSGVDPSAEEMAPRERLYFYQRNIERVVGSPEALREEVKAALLRELGAPESDEHEER